MRGWLFAVFLLTLLVSVVITALGLLANWGIWMESSVVERGEELPLLRTMVTGVLVASVGLVLELGRRWFIARNVNDEVTEVYVQLISAAVVLPTSMKEEADTAFTIVHDFFEQQVPMESVESRLVISDKVKTAVSQMIEVRYGGAAQISPAYEVLSDVNEGA